MAGMQKYRLVLIVYDYVLLRKNMIIFHAVIITGSHQSYPCPINPASRKEPTHFTWRDYQLVSTGSYFYLPQIHFLNCYLIILKTLFWWFLLLDQNLKYLKLRLLRQPFIPSRVQPRPNYLTLFHTTSLNKSSYNLGVMCTLSCAKLLKSKSHFTIF